jgi:ParB-like chromosome segregation protein Spo0J
MRKVIRLEDVELAPPWFPREGVEGDHVESLREALRRGETLPPIVVDKDLRVIDGVHRAYALINEGVDEVEAEVLEVDEDTAWVEAVRYNTEHGLPLTVVARRVAFEKAWKAGVIPRLLATKSAEEVAKSYGVTTETLNTWIKKVRGVARRPTPSKPPAPTPSM